jgi:3-methyladenine DNA glycosylase AlkD
MTSAKEKTVLYEKALKEVEKAVMNHAPEKIMTGYHDLQSYIGTKYKVLGIDAKTQRGLTRSGYSFSGLPLQEQLLIWDHLWQQAGTHELLSQALLFIDRHLNKLDPTQTWKITSKWVKRIDNWAHSDLLSKFFSHWLVKKPDMVYPQLQKWNRSKNPWERRQSLVSLVGYVKKKDEFLPVEKLLVLITPLLKDPDYFVQKGLGWALRETGETYPAEIWKFLLPQPLRLQRRNWIPGRRSS